MKKSLVFVIIAISLAAILTACGTAAPSGSAADTGTSAVTAESGAKTEPIEVDAKNLPEGITKEDLTEEDGKYYLDQTKFKELALKAGKNLTIQAVNGFAYTASAKGNMVTGVAMTEQAKEEYEKQVSQNQNAGNANTQGAGTQSGTTNYPGTSQGTGSNQGGSSSGNSGGGTSSGGGYVAPVTQPTTQPVHQHTWVAHTTTVDQGWYEDIYEWHQVCNGCGAIVDGWDSTTLVNHLADCGPGSYRGAYVTVGQQWVSNPVTVTDYYYCSGCGATQ